MMKKDIRAKADCDLCHGSGKCSWCEGDGQKTWSAAKESGDPDRIGMSCNPCDACGSTGYCICTGKNPVQKLVDKDAKRLKQKISRAIREQEQARKGQKKSRTSR